MPLPATGSPWFIFVESPDRIWFFDGSNKLSNHLSNTGKGVVSGPAILDGKLRQDSPTIPAQIASRLPAGLQKLVQPEEPPAGRPSF